MNDYKATNYNDDEIVIDIKDMLGDVFCCIRRYFLIMLAVICAAVIAGGVWMQVSYQPMYKAESLFTVRLKDSGKSSSYEYTYNASTENQLEKPLDGVVASALYEDMICTGLGMEKLEETLTLSSVGGTSQFRLAVTGTDPDRVIQVSEKAIEYLPQASKKVIGTSSLTIKQEAEKPTAPYNVPQTKKGILYGGVLGVVFCLAIMFFYAFRRINCVHKESDLKELLGIRSYGKLIRNDEATARSVVLRLEKDMKAQSRKVLWVEGSVADADNAGIALAIAQMLAKSGKKVLLIDCNLITPGYRDVMMDAHVQDGFSKVLSGVCELKQCVYPLNAWQIDLLANDEAAADAYRQISQDGFAELVSTAGKQYDYVVLTSPGRQSTCGKNVVSGLADGVVYVTEKGTVSAQKISAEIERIGKSKAAFMGGIYVCR